MKAVPGIQDGVPSSSRHGRRLEAFTGDFEPQSVPMSLNSSQLVGGFSGGIAPGALAAARDR